MNESFMKRHPLLTMLIAVGIALVLCIVAAVVWYNSNADLDRVRLVAKELGVELDADAFRRPVSSSHLLQQLERLTYLSKQKNLLFVHSDFAEASELIAGKRLPSLYGGGYLKYGEPVPQHIYEFYNNHMDQSVHDELMSCIAELKGHKLQDAQEWKCHLERSHYIGLQLVLMHLNEWMLTLSKDRFNVELKSAFALLEIYPDGPIDDYNAKADDSIGLLETILRRIEDVDPKIVQEIDVVLRNLKSDFQRSLQVECIFVMDLMETISGHDISEQYKHAPTFFEDIGFRVRHRVMRERELTLLIRMTSSAQKGYDEYRKCVSNLEKIAFAQGSLIVKRWIWPLDRHDDKVAKFQLLRAILAKTPLPKDAYGNAYKEIHDTKGNILGYYSIGRDGSDDGWDRERWRPMWIYGELE